MVDTLLIVISSLSLLIWFAQEQFVRSQLLKNSDAVINKNRDLTVEQFQQEVVPGWNEWLFRIVFLMWACFVGAVILVKDGDFAFVLVILTLFAGLVSALDFLLFSRARRAYIKTEKVTTYLAKYVEEQRETLAAFLQQDMIVAEYAKSFFPVLAVVLVLRSFIVEPFQIPSASMVPTLEVGDYILVNKFHYGIRLPVLGTKIFDINQPERGDIMVFFPPHDKRYFIKRVIGVPGDNISYINKELTINGKKMSQTLMAELPAYKPEYRLMKENLEGIEHLIHNAKHIYQGDFSITVKPGHYFMMGDNRDNSSDSRVWGQVPEENIVGKAFAIWMHWGSFTDLPSFSRVGLLK
ncbi:signal peptidase I [bacterium AH-315-K03]|nr:signal peptidase I [bacterium AH-315-K03]